MSRGRLSLAVEPNQPRILRPGSDGGGNQSNEILVLLRKRGPLFGEGRSALRTENKGSRLSGMDRRGRPPHDRRTWHPLVPRRRPDARPRRPRNTRLHHSPNQSRARKQAVTSKPPIHLNQNQSRTSPIPPTPPPMPRNDLAYGSPYPATTQKKANKRQTTFPKPAQTCSLTTQPTGDCGPCSMRLSRLSPSTNSITMNVRPLASPISWTVQTFG